MTTITIHHTAFAHHNTVDEDVATTKMITTGDVTDADALREEAFCATNAPESCMTPAQKVLAMHAVKTGRTYSTSVGDLVEIEDENGHHTLAVVAPCGFKQLAEGYSEVVRYLVRTVGKFSCLTDEHRMFFFSDLARNA